MPEALGTVFNDLPFEDRLAIAISKKRVVLGLANIQADHQLLAAAPNPLLELTKFILNPVAVSTGGGNFLLGVQASAGVPMAGISCYLFAVDGAYLCPLSVTARWTWRRASRGRPLK